MEEKHCRYCDRTLAITNFHLKKKRKDGTYLRSDRCKDCTLEYSRRYRDENRETINQKARGSRSRNTQENLKKVYHYLLSHPCVDCGEDDPRVLEFDHIDRSTKEFPIARGYSRPWEALKAEMDKCAIRCANCHRIKTGLEMGWWRSLPKVGSDPQETAHARMRRRQKEQAVEMLMDGLTRKEVAESLELSFVTISRWCLYDPYVAPLVGDITIKRFNSCPNGHPYTEKDWDGQGFHCRTCRKDNKARNYTPTPPREFCGRGLHEWIPENIIKSPRGDGTMKDICRPCKNERNRKFYHKS